MYTKIKCFRFFDSDADRIETIVNDYLSERNVQDNYTVQDIKQNVVVTKDLVKTYLTVILERRPYT